MAFILFIMTLNLVVFFVKHSCRRYQIFTIEKKILQLNLAKDQYQEELNPLRKALLSYIYFYKKVLFSLII